MKIVNISDFGAKGDGVSDDSKAFNDGLAALERAGGGILAVGQGVYVVTTILIQSSNIYMIGTNRELVKIKQKLIGESHTPPLI